MGSPTFLSSSLLSSPPEKETFLYMQGGPPSPTPVQPVRRPSHPTIGVNPSESSLASDPSKIVYIPVAQDDRRTYRSDMSVQSIKTCSLCKARCYTITSFFLGVIVGIFSAVLYINNNCSNQTQEP